MASASGSQTEDIQTGQVSGPAATVTSIRDLPIVGGTGLAAGWSDQGLSPG